MAEIVAVYAVPHTPSFIADVQRDGEASDTARYFMQVRAHLDAAAPDVLVIVGTDHFNTFFYDNWPMFAVALADRTSGPNDQTPGMPRYDVRIEAGAARHILRSLVDDEFDVASSLELEVDHGLLVPLHFMTPTMALPIVPVFVNCLVAPLPSARRCQALGRSLARAIRGWESDARVAVIASGSLSLEIGGPRAHVGKTFGVPDPDWSAWVQQCVAHCEHDALIAAATEARMLEAGNVAGELLSWIVALGIVGPCPPAILIDQPDLGNAFAVWNMEDGGGRLPHP